jgi:hypothetical protein
VTFAEIQCSSGWSPSCAREREGVRTHLPSVWTRCHYTTASPLTGLLSPTGPHVILPQALREKPRDVVSRAASGDEQFATFE